MKRWILAILSDIFLIFILGRVLVGEFNPVVAIGITVIACMVATFVSVKSHRALKKEVSINEIDPIVKRRSIILIIIGIIVGLIGAILLICK